jgi:hypothetical protein
VAQLPVLDSAQPARQALCGSEAAGRPVAALDGPCAADNHPQEQSLSMEGIAAVAVFVARLVCEIAEKVRFVDVSPYFSVEPLT